MRTLIPILLLIASFCYRAQLLRPSEASPAQAKANQALAEQLLTFNFVLVYLLFPSNSAAIFATFQCEELDDPDQSSFLRIDFAVDCNTSSHRGAVAYAALMVLVYPIG